MTNVAVIGYASIDYPAVLDGYFTGDQTVLIKERPTDAFPRPGGCPLYVAGPIAAHSHHTSIITWVGDDEPGRFFTSSAMKRGIQCAGIATVDAGATPICFLLYQADGSCGCCFDPGFLGSESLTAKQIRLTETADIFCFTVGPPNIAAQTLDQISEEKKIAWIAKNDPKSYPEDLRIRLGARADFIFCNSSEREWIDMALRDRERPPPLIVQTNGANPVILEIGENQRRLNVPPLSFNDSSGAGDTLAGGCLAAIAGGENDLTAIGDAGISAARQLLEARAKK